MATRGKGHIAGHPKDREGDEQSPKSLKIAESGVNSSLDFRNLMSAIMSDVIAGRLTPNMTNAACNAGGKLLKMVDLEYRYGTNPSRERGTLRIAFETPVAEIAGEVASGSRTE